MKKCKYSKLSNYILEGIGSFFLVFFAAGAVMSNAFYNGPIGQLMGGFSSGLILFILISSLGKYSRGHVNPAVTIMEYRLGYIGSRTAFFYIIFQMIFNRSNCMNSETRNPARSICVIASRNYCFRGSLCINKQNLC